MALYEIVRKARGKETIEDSGDLAKMNKRIKELRKSTRKGVSGRGGKKYSVEYSLREKPGT